MRYTNRHFTYFYFTLLYFFYFRWAVIFDTARRELGGLPAQSPPHCTNETAHPSTASVPITVLLLYDGSVALRF